MGGPARTLLSDDPRLRSARYSPTQAGVLWLLLLATPTHTRGAQFARQRGKSAVRLLATLESRWPGLRATFLGWVLAGGNRPRTAHRAAIYALFRWNGGSVPPVPHCCACGAHCGDHKRTVSCAQCGAAMCEACAPLEVCPRCNQLEAT